MYAEIADSKIRLIILRGCDHKMYRHFLVISLFLLACCSRSAESYVSRGDRFYAEGNYDDASLNYSNALKKNPELGEIQYKLGLALMKRDKAGAAAEALWRAVGLMPKDVRSRVALADTTFAVYFQSGQRQRGTYDVIVRLADEILALDPDSPDAYRLKGALSLLDRDARKSLEYYQKAHSLRPEDGEIVLGYMQALFADRRAAESEALALVFLQKHAQFAPVYDVLYQQYRVSGRSSDSLAVLNRWSAANPYDSTALLRAASYYAGSAQRTEMTATLNRMLERAEKIPLAWMKVGDFYSSIGELDQAKHVYLRGSRADKPNARLYERKIAEIFVSQGKILDAIGFLDDVVQHNPGDSDVRRMRATLWIETGKPEKLKAALAEFLALVKDKSDDPGLQYDVGRTLLRMNEADSAQAYFLRAASLRRDFLEPRVELARLNAVKQNHSESLRYAEEILAISPGNPEGRLLLASGRMGTGRLTEAGDDLRRLLKDYPQYREAQILSGLLAINQRRYKDAEIMFSKFAGSRVSDPRATLGLAAAYTFQKQFDSALQVLTAEARKSPDSLTLQNALVLAALQARNYPLAIDFGRRAVQSHPESISGYLKLAEAYRLIGDITKAVETLDRSRQVEVRDPGALRDQATAYFRVGRLEDSKQILRKVVQLQSADASTFNDLAFLIAETGGDMNEAEKLAQQSLQRAEASSNARDTLGWIYLKKNKISQALQIFENLVRRYPESSTFRYHLGAALLQSGENVKGRSELQVALSKKPDPTEAKAIQVLLSADR